MSKWRETGGEEDQECDGKTELRGIWEEWEEIGEQQQKKELETGDRGCRERKVRKEKDDRNHGNVTPDDRDNKRRIATESSSRKYTWRCPKCVKHQNTVKIISNLGLCDK